MTEWIDRLRNGLSDSQRRANDSRNEKLLDDSLLQSRMPEFLEGVTKAFEDLAAELSDKVGPVDFKKRGNGFQIQGGKSVKLDVLASYDLRGHHMQFLIKKIGAAYVSGDGAMTTYSLYIDGNKLVYAAQSSQPDGRKMLYSGEEIASEILQKAVTADMF
ncbi:MAG TPA: hypothetical protein VGI12_15655 [Vicinamibacterales bacterium]